MPLIEFKCTNCGKIEIMHVRQKQLDNWVNEKAKWRDKTTKTIEACCESPCRKSPSHPMQEVDSDLGISIAKAYGVHYWSTGRKNEPWEKISEEWYNKLSSYRKLR